MTRPEEASEPDERLDQDMRKDDERQRNECREETKGTGTVDNLHPRSPIIFSGLLSDMRCLSVV